MRTQGSAEELEARRRHAAEYFQAGKSLRTVARLLGVHLSSVKRWKKAWKSGGVEALAAKPHPGGMSKLSEQQKQELVELLVAGSLAAGYRTDLWTCARVAKVVRKRFRVDYDPGHLLASCTTWDSVPRSLGAWPATRCGRSRALAQTGLATNQKKRDGAVQPSFLSMGAILLATGQSSHLGTPWGNTSPESLASP